MFKALFWSSSAFFATGALLFMVLIAVAVWHMAQKRREAKRWEINPVRGIRR
jgi:hypothetical protein